MLWYEVTSLVLYYISLPIVKLCLLLLYILRILVSPIVYLFNALWSLLLIPYNVLAKFEVRKVSSMTQCVNAEYYRLFGIS